MNAQIGLDNCRILLNLFSGALGNDAAVVQYGNTFANTHDQLHIVLDEHDGDLEGIANLADVGHQFSGLGGVHAGGGLVQQQQGRLGSQGANDLQAALCTVGQGTCLMACQILHVKDGQQIQRPLVHLLFVLPVAGKTEDAADGGILLGIVQADFDVVLNGQVGEQADILEGTGDTCAVHLHGVHAGSFLAVEKDGAVGGLVYLGQQVEDGGLACAVGADQTGDFGLTDGQVEIINRLQAAELDAQVARFKYGSCVKIALRNDTRAGDRNHFLLLITHACAPPSLSSFLLWDFANRPSMNILMRSLLETSMTRISTMA